MSLDTKYLSVPGEVSFSIRLHNLDKESNVCPYPYRSSEKYRKYYYMDNSNNHNSSFDISIRSLKFSKNSRANSFV